MKNNLDDCEKVLNNSGKKSTKEKSFSRSINLKPDIAVMVSSKKKKNISNSVPLTPPFIKLTIIIMLAFVAL